MLRILLISFITLYCFSGYAKTSGESGSTVQNLKGQAYSQCMVIKGLIDKTQAKANNAYLFSMPLLASAEQGDWDLYRKILSKMRHAIKTEGEPAKRAWLLGRVLLAADSIGDHYTAIKMETEIKELIAKGLPENAFSAWAYGYLAGSSMANYHEYSKTMLESAAKLTKKYKIAKIEKKISLSELQDSLTDAMWAWVMALQAAANAGDKKDYLYILHQMQMMTQQLSVVGALQTGLTKNDYPAWAFGIVRLAAATMNDEKLFIALQKPLEDLLKITKQDDERMLGEVNAALASVRRLAVQALNSTP